MANVEMSLDEIIALQKKQRGPGRTAGGRRGGRQNTQNNNNTRKPQRKFVDHDAARGPHVTGGNPNKSVRVNITNLAPSVSSSDLEDLFGNYNIEAALVHHNEFGQSLGTGDIYLAKRDALRVIKDFAGVALDEQIMRMFLVDGTQDLGSRLDFPQRSRGVQRKEAPNRNGGNRRRGGNNAPRGGNVGGRKKGENKPKKSEAELDAELDAYMNTSKA
ncbi:unnamed protein product [Auanema sp. JU1783]|nr:unnamed protein product [Auanema sp. JU1783]